MTAVSALEENPPLVTGKGKKGNGPLHWMLLTTEDAAGLDTARTVLRWYELRWRIERFFHALKVGTRIEDRHLDEADDLRKCLAFDAITAFRVWDLSLLAREKPDDPAGRHVTRQDVTALCALAAHHGFKVPRGPPDMTIARFVVLTAGLAGFHPSKRQPLPGTQKLWEGVRFLSNAVIAIRAMQDWDGDGSETKGEFMESSCVRLIGELPLKVDICPPNPYISCRHRRLEMPGKSHREGLTIVQLMDMFPTEDAAREWFEAAIWPNGRHCPKCGSVRTKEASHAKMPYWCTDCRSYFSVKTNTAMQASKIPLRKWAIAVYMCLTNLKSVSSMKLSRDLGVKQQTAWFMLHRIREAWASDDDDQFDGPVEVDEVYMGGLRENMPLSKRKTLKGRGPVGKTVVVGVKDRETNEVRAEVVARTDGATLKGFIHEHVEPGAKVFTDKYPAYQGLKGFDHEAVNHKVSEYVRGMAHTNGIESFWAMLRRAHDGTFHKMSPKHLQRYVSEFAGKHNVRDSGTVAQMRDTVAHLVGRNLLYRDLIADNGLASGRGL